MNQPNHRIAALLSANEKKRELTYKRTCQTLQMMEEANLPINFETVAKMAGVSKTWLY